MFLWPHQSPYVESPADIRCFFKNTRLLRPPNLHLQNTKTDKPGNRGKPQGFKGPCSEVFGPDVHVFLQVFGPYWALGYVSFKNFRCSTEAFSARQAVAKGIVAYYQKYIDEASKKASGGSPSCPLSKSMLISCEYWIYYLL